MTLTDTLKKLVKYETGLDYILAGRNEGMYWEDKVLGLVKLGIGLAELSLLYRSFNKATSGQLDEALHYIAFAIILEAAKYAYHRINMKNLSDTSTIFEQVTRNYPKTNL